MAQWQIKKASKHKCHAVHFIIIKIINNSDTLEGGGESVLTKTCYNSHIQIKKKKNELSNGGFALISLTGATPNIW